MIVEAFFTMIFVSTVLFVKYRGVSSTSDGMLSNLTVAISLYVCVRMCGPLTGAALNPTIAIVIITTDSLSFAFDSTSSNPGYFVFLFSYICGPLLGGLMAAYLLKLSLKISNESVEASDSTYHDEDEVYVIGGNKQGHNNAGAIAMTSTAINGETASQLDDGIAFDDERRNSGRNMTMMFDNENN